METVCQTTPQVLEALGSEILRNLLLILGLATAIASVVTSKIIARRKQTADLMFGSRSDEQLNEGYSVIRQLHDDPNGNIRAVFPAKREVPDDPAEAEKLAAQKEKTQKISYVLNYWERISIGIDEGIYCERMLRYTSNTTLINLYTQALPFIEAVRERSRVPTYFVDIERLALRWKSKPLKPKRIKRIGFL
ncbi:DUF4760 domain-containing protein [Pseudomonas shirazica]|uniref:DUF4760 domain-containing protein n=1 Tax=Pseudomonas TaxID=286 RepID=UPI000863641C|nr:MULTISPECIES: DUF4760 domain-containing protein [Pseudomonas]EKT4484015.1 DUF4760 domain-containing protein [Pseudomonas putida]EKT4502697.1 DUF4760 domain-containing protein [Pseudomonas putida]MDM9598650.1 DUF4760 domain-containing protein [Pseudomonas shirazica]MDO2412078.1 DUF4760 domain-containing protein [Pseudomonas shirazica]